MPAQVTAANLKVFLGLQQGGNETTAETTFLGLATEGKANARSAIYSSGLYDGILLTVASFALLVVLELASLDSVRGVFRQAGGRALYATAVLYNVINLFAIGPLTYAFAVQFLCVPPKSAMGSAVAFGGLVATHALGYYIAHFAMHTKPLYWAHRFHHRFNSHVVPMAANAVTFTEYGIAYMLPFIAGCTVFRPDGRALFAAVALISLNNILIHTPGLEALSRRVLPWWAVSTSDHIDHHRRLTTNYAAPTVSIDKLLAAALGSAPKTKGA